MDERCQTCKNLVDPEDLFCGNCGRQVAGPAVDTEQGSSSAEIEEGFVGFDCETCGASITFDSTQQGLRCAFCGSVTLKRQMSATGRIRASWLIPFQVAREAAVRAFSAWTSRGFFRPFGFQRGAKLSSMSPVLIPFWVFRARTHTYYAADTSATPAFARASWCPVSGEMEGEIDEVLVPASGSLSLAEVSGIEPFDFQGSRAYERAETQGYAVEDFGLSRRGARPLARTRMLEIERSLASSRVPGKSRNVHVNTLFTEMRSEPMLLPVWINAYVFKGTTYRFLVNGQTGKALGKAPFSLAKVALIVLGVLFAVLVILALAR